MNDSPPSAPLPTDPVLPAPRPRRAWTILGRLSQAVREQNWFAVGLEVLIVVLGVVIGFQVMGWGQARADQAREQGYLERIHEDLLADTQALVGRVAYDARVTGYAEAAVAHAETGSLHVQRYITASCVGQEGIEQTLTDCEAPISDTEAAALLDRYRAPPGLANDLRSWASTLGIITIVLAINRDAADALIARVAPTLP